MHPLKKAARIAGAMYLSMVITGPFQSPLRSRQAHCSWKRHRDREQRSGARYPLSFRNRRRACSARLLFICLAVALYRLLSDVNKTWARLMFGFVLVAAAVGFVNELNDLGARILFHGGEFLSVFDKTQLDALGMLFIRLHGQGNMIAEIFWGLWLFPFGLLVFRSGFLPRFIGVWLMINCFGYLVLSMTALFFPAYNDKLFLYFQPVFFGELAIMLYLLIKGAKVPTSCRRSCVNRHAHEDKTYSEMGRSHDSYSRSWHGSSSPTGCRLTNAFATRARPRIQ